MKNYLKQIYYGFTKQASEIEYFESVILGTPIWFIIACVFWYIGDCIL